MASLTPRFMQGRNALCGCGSGLKFKYCHGDNGKAAVCEHYLHEIMFRLIMKEKHKQGLLTDEEYKNWIARAKGEAKPLPINELDVGEILDKAKLKRCNGALCGAPIPDTEEFCVQCKKRLMKGN